MTQCPTRAAALVIVEREKEKWLSQAARVVKDPHAASDVLQDFRVAILSSNSLPKEEEQLRRYLRRVMTYVAYRWLRKNLNSRVEHCESPEERLQSTEQADQMPSGDADFGPVDLDFRRADLGRRARALLPPKCLEVFTEVLRAGAIDAEVATKLGMPLATVKAHFQRALQKLRGKESPGGKS